MGTETKKLLEDEIRTEIQNLSKFETGSKEKSDAIDDVAKLYKLMTDEAKNEGEIEEKRESRIADMDKTMQELAEKREARNVEVNQYTTDQINKNREFEEQAIDRYIRLGVAIAEIVLPLMFYATWMDRGFKFEETGTYTSTTFRGLFGRFRATKKG